MISCIVESKNDQICGFYYDNYDIDATIYINGQVAMSQQSGDERYFENKLKIDTNVLFQINNQWYNNY